MKSVNKVTIFGYASATEEEPLYKQVFEVAKLLAENGFVVVQGGGTGLMRAAGQGAKAGGGKTISVTLAPDALTEVALSNFEGKDPNNPFDEEIITHSYVERTLTLMQQGDVYVIFNGGTGTVSEFGMAWGLAKIYFGQHKPLILFGGWWHNIMETFARNMYIRDAALKVYKIVDEPAEVIEAINDLSADLDYFQTGSAGH